MNTKDLVNQSSSTSEKIALFQSLFRGRADVYPRRFQSRKTQKAGYTPACSNEWVRPVCQKPKIKCSDCAHRRLIPITEEIIYWHLQGYDNKGEEFVMGIYPMLLDETCYFLAADFDKTNWEQDAVAFLKTCHRMDLPAVLERSRSGNGGHVWLFFEEAISASLARRLGALILTETMEAHPQLGLDSYDRFFPNQDTLPRGSFGNLIALPLQKVPRQHGNSVFVDEQLQAIDDQWAFLTNIKKIAYCEVERLVAEAEAKGRVVGVRLEIVDEENKTPWKPPVSLPIVENLPKKLQLVLSNEIFIEKETLPAPLLNRLIRIAAFQNPDFYKAQAMRLPVYDKPRIIGCARDYSHHIGLPRGCLDEIIKLFKDLKIKYTLQEELLSGQALDCTFHGELREEQQLAVEALIKSDIGVLSATTAFGKTVIAAWLIAKRKVSTLVIVHTKQLQDQWVDRLQTFLGIPRNQIGCFGGGRKKLKGLIDIALIQSIVKNNDVAELISQYGQVIVDECHHIPSNSFDEVIRQIKARFIVGLSATLARKDGRHPIITMRCGPVLYRVDAKAQGLHHSKKEVHVYDYVDLAVPMLDRMFQRRVRAYEGVGYKIIQPASAYAGWPSDVVLPADPLWKNDHAAVIQRLVIDGVDNSLAQLFSNIAHLEIDQIDRARSMIEAFLFYRLETLPQTKGRFHLNHELAIPFDSLGCMEVDLLCKDSLLAIEIDGIQHLATKDAYRSDRRKDLLLQEQGYMVLRFLAEDVSKRLDVVLDTILRVLHNRQSTALSLNQGRQCEPNN